MLTPVIPSPRRIAMLLLGCVVLGTGVAYIAYYWLIDNVGAVRSSLVAYVIPVVGVTAGANWSRPPARNLESKFHRSVGRGSTPPPARRSNRLRLNTTAPANRGWFNRDRCELGTRR